MPYLLRLQLPDVPGSLGKVASALGEAGADIEAIQVVDKTGDGSVVDDVLLDLPPGKMPDSVVSACNGLDGVRVLWISHYGAGGNLFLDLELVEELTAHPDQAYAKMLDLMPVTFRVDWAVHARRGHDPETGTSRAIVVDSAGATPEDVEWVDVDRAGQIDSWDDNQVICAVPLGDDLFLLGRRGGPEFLDSEVARLDHLVGLARSISRTHDTRAADGNGDGLTASVPDSML